MTLEQRKRIHLIYGIVLSAVTVLAGLCLMAACLNIYAAGGPEPYSRETVAAHFAPIAAPVYLCLVLVLGGFLLDACLPLAGAKIKPVKQHGVILRRLLAKTDYSDSPEASRILALERRRKVNRIVSLLLFGIGSAVFLVFVLNSSHWHQSDINSSMVKAMQVMLASLALPFCFSIYSAWHNSASIQKEITLVKAIGANKEAESPAPQSQSRALTAARSCLLILAVGLLLYGFFAGGTADVLTKAVNICTECIGLG